MPGNITRSISDHLIQFVILEDFINPLSRCKSNLCEQNCKKLDRNKLREDLYKTYWGKVIHKNDNNTNDGFHSFCKILTEILDHPAPLTIITKNEQKLHLKPLMNKEIKYLMWKKR